MNHNTPILARTTASPSSHPKAARKILWRKLTIIDVCLAIGLGFAALQGLLKRHANKALIGNSVFFCPAAHGV
jgi:hypothetical protein